jgi:hypothetical protein
VFEQVKAGVDGQSRSAKAAFEGRFILRQHKLLIPAKGNYVEENTNAKCK